MDRRLGDPPRCGWRCCRCSSPPVARPPRAAQMRPAGKVARARVAAPRARGRPVHPVRAPARAVVAAATEPAVATPEAAETPAAAAPAAMVATAAAAAAPAPAERVVVEARREPPA